jgi:hypothetical protein
MRGRDFMKRGLKDWAFNEGIDKGPDLIAEKIAKHDFEKFSPASRSENQGVKEKKEKSLADRQHTTKPVESESITWGTVAEPIRRTEKDLRIIVPRTTAQHTVFVPAGIPILAPLPDVPGQIVKPLRGGAETPYWSGAVIGITVASDTRTEIPCPIGRRPGISPRITG